MAAPRLGKIDSHIHLWSPDTVRFPRAAGAPAIPEHLVNPGTFQEMHDKMVAAGVQGALVVQPVNYGQDYSYMEEAEKQFPGFFKGMFVADPSAADPISALRALKAAKPGFWVGVRFNPYKWSDPSMMSGEVGRALFRSAGDLGLPVGFMPFKGLAVHIDAIEALMQDSPATQVIIDHWGFFVQPATGFGDNRDVVEESWKHLLRIGREYPQVHVKLSGMFRNSLEGVPFASLDPRLEQLLDVFSAKRLLWGSDAPYFLDFGDYSNSLALETWPLWQRLDDEQRADILSGTAEKLFGPWPLTSGQTSEL